MSKIYCGCDNGVTGTIGILGEEIEMFCKTPIKKEQDCFKIRCCKIYFSI